MVGAVPQADQRRPDQPESNGGLRAHPLNSGLIRHGSRTVSGSEAQRPDAPQEPGVHLRGDRIDRHRRGRQRGHVQHGGRPRAASPPGAATGRRHDRGRRATGPGPSQPGDVLPGLRRRARRHSQFRAPGRLSARGRGLRDRKDELAQRRVGVASSENLLDASGVTPRLGRWFRDDENAVVGRSPVVVLAHDTWTEQFGADPNIIDRRVLLSGIDFTVIGVAPEGFTGLDPYIRPGFYVPVAMAPSLNASAPATYSNVVIRAGCA